MKKKNEDNPIIQEDNGEALSAEALEFINRLLERLHLLDNERNEKLKNESKIEFVYVASGGQHVETQYISLTPRSAEGRLQGKNPSIPEQSSPTRSLSKGEGRKERKPNWREYTATVEDIQNFLMDRILLRHNVITGRVEYRIPDGAPLSSPEWDTIDSDRTIEAPSGAVRGGFIAAHLRPRRE